MLSLVVILLPSLFHTSEQDPPKILSDPSAKTRVEGESVTLTCRYEGKPISDAQWYRNNTKLNDSLDSRINISRSGNVSLTESSLTITGLLRTDEGLYHCQVNNTIGKAVNSNATQLTVNYPPEIFVSPTSLVTNETNNVILSCVLEGKPQPSVTWTKNGTKIDVDGNSRISAAHPWSYGNSTASLTIENVNRSDEGSYVCVADNNIGSNVSSSAVNLTVNYPSRILMSPENATQNENQSVVFACYVEGKPISQVTWWHDQRQINTSQSRYEITNPAGFGKSIVRLTIQHLTRRDEGFYRCRAENELQSEFSTSAYLTVQFSVQPKILSDPSAKTRVERESVTLTCRYEGKPISDAQWYRNNTKLENSSNSRINIRRSGNVSLTESFLTITGLSRTDEGLYHCRVDNEVGKALNSTAAQLTVNYPPVIFVSPTSLVTNETNNVILSCVLEGKPQPNVIWTKNGTKIDVDGNSRISAAHPWSYGNSTASLTIENVNRSDEGSYACVANNNIGSNVSSSAANLTVNFIILSILNPGANFTVTSGQTAKLVCVVSGHSPVITWYRHGKGIPSTNTRVTSSNTQTADLTVNNVQPEDSGVYNCTASINKKLVSTQMTLVVNVPVEVDMDITVENMEFTEDLYNSSSPLFQNLSNTFKKEMSSIYEDIEGFKEIQVLGFSNGSVKVRFRVVFEIKVDKPSNKPPLDVKQKVANAAIEKITKTNGVIGALKFVPDSITSLVPPPSPRNLTTTHIKEKEISIAWKKPEYHRSYGITGYEVQYKEFGQRWNNIRVYGKDINDHVIHDLKEETRYSIRMVATNKLGKGPPSNQLEVSTKKESLWNKIWSDYKWVIIAVGIALFLLILTGIFLCCRKRKRKITVKRQQSSRRKQGNFKISGQSFRNQGFEMAQLASRFREIPRDQIMIGKELGSGQFGLVTRGYLKQDRMHCAIKMLKADCSDSHYRDLLNELDIMSSVEEHPNIINLIGACTQGGPVYVITELAEHGCLLDFLHNNQMYSISHQDKLSILSEAEKIRIGRDVARGLEHLTRFRCVHRDLAARNVLLGTNMTAKLSDFGLARDVYEKGYYQQLSNMKKLPVRWMSIEAIETLVATKESDIWSFGILLWEIHTGGKLPYHGLSTKEILKTLKKGTRPEQPVNCSDEMYSIMRSCWHSSPSKRPTIELLATVLDRQLQLRRNEEALQNSSFA